MRKVEYEFFDNGTVKVKKAGKGKKEELFRKREKGRKLFTQESAAKKERSFHSIH